MTSFTIEQLDGSQGFYTYRVEAPFKPEDRKDFRRLLGAAGDPIALSDGRSDLPTIMVDQTSDERTGLKGFEITTRASRTQVAESISAALKPSAPRR